MADLFAEAVSFVDEHLDANAAQAVTYHRGAASVTITCPIGRHDWDVDTLTSVMTRHENVDLLPKVSDLVLNSVEVEPQRGDRWKWPIGGTTYVFEVAGPGGNPTHEYANRYRTRWRIHSKFVDTE